MLSSKPKVPSIGSATKPTALGVSTTVKMPKAKSAPDPFGKKSLLTKSENIKSSSVRKLHDFLQRKIKD